MLVSNSWNDGIIVYDGITAHSLYYLGRII